MLFRLLTVLAAIVGFFLVYWADGKLQEWLRRSERVRKVHGIIGLIVAVGAMLGLSFIVGWSVWIVIAWVIWG